MTSVQKSAWELAILVIYSPCQMNVVPYVASLHSVALLVEAKINNIEPKNVN